MNKTILQGLVAQHIPSYQFHFLGEGDNIHWMSPDFDTPENRAIVADVIKNYDTLAAEVEKAGKEATEKESLIQSKMREQAISALKVEGKLTADGKMVSIKEELL
jgi:hypothetical protein